MVAAYHLIWTVYGWWLPNDPRGSSSHEIRQDLIAELGELHHGRKKVQPSGRIISQFYEQARLVLKHELRTFSDDEVAIIAGSFAAVIRAQRYTCYACAIMPDHVHIVIRKHRDLAEDMIAKLQARSWEDIIAAQLRASDHPVWGGLGWKVFLDSCEDIERTIKYVADNPIKMNRLAQTYDFVQEYDGWLPGIGARNRKR